MAQGWSPLCFNRTPNEDWSHNKHTLIKDGGAEATGGSTTGIQQNTAQDGRQNANCANAHGTLVSVAGGRANGHCDNKDSSHSKHTTIKGGGAEASGGSSGTGLVQQNTAQAGRQNANCVNPNNAVISLTDSRSEARCMTLDHSKSVHAAEFGRGAESAGGSAPLGFLALQNTAQTGRQNDNCANPNGLSLTASGSHLRTQCSTVDISKNIHAVRK
ncbi:hypothetical protein [Streptomyces sp. NPDC051776]|uniref:hypothetical protein n=1 Tax=Streptomyces sp. NPDC051776 TaxID=3155414 RepID=UPI0034347F1E